MPIAKEKAQRQQGYQAKDSDCQLALSRGGAFFEMPV